MTVSTRTVTGTYQKLDGSPCSGSVRVTPNAGTLPAWMQASPGGAFPGLLNLGQAGAALKYSISGAGLSVLPGAVTLSGLVAQQRGIWIGAAA